MISSLQIASQWPRFDNKCFLVVQLRTLVPYSLNFISKSSYRDTLSFTDHSIQSLVISNCFQETLRKKHEALDSSTKQAIDNSQLIVICQSYLYIVYAFHCVEWVEHGSTSSNLLLKCEKSIDIKIKGYSTPSSSTIGLKIELHYFLKVSIQLANVDLWSTPMA